MTNQPRSKNETEALVLFRAPEGVSRAPEINEDLKKQGLYFGDGSTRVMRSDRDSR